MNYLWLTLLSIFAIDWAYRMIKYAQTKDAKYKHKIMWWK